LHSERSLSSPSPERLAAWRLFLESATALIDVMDRELQDASSLPLRWYDVLVHLEETEGGRLRMGDLANEIVSSKSGLTRVIDRVEQAGLVRRERPTGDRRVVEVVLTPAGLEALHAARPGHRHDIERYFARHLDDDEVRVLTQALRKVRDEVRHIRAANGLPDGTRTAARRAAGRGSGAAG
jgi:DNA-binding MarR family transcriptional regulator